MMAEIRPDNPSEWSAMKAVAAKLGVTTTEESAEFKRLKRENAELRRANEILKAAAGFFAAELGRPHKD